MFWYWYAATTQHLSGGFCGSPHYAAPEVHDGSRRYDGAAADVWSAGVVLFCMLSNCLPFSGEEGSPALAAKVYGGEWEAQPVCSEAGVNLLHAMLTVDPDARASLADIYAHAWLAGEREQRPSE